jgi:hypothetical protein
LSPQRKPPLVNTLDGVGRRRMAAYRGEAGLSLIGRYRVPFGAGAIFLAPNISPLAACRPLGNDRAMDIPGRFGGSPMRLRR